MSKLVEIRDYKTGVMQEIAGVRFMPLEDSSNGYVDRRPFVFQMQLEDGSWGKMDKNTVITCASGPVVLFYDRKTREIGATVEARLASAMRDISDLKAGIALNRPAGRVLGFVMGAKEAGETMHTAALREAKEETGLSADYLWVGPEIRKDQSICADILGLHVAEFDSIKAKQKSYQVFGSDGESIRLVVMSLEEFGNKMDAGEFDAVGMAIGGLFLRNLDKIVSQWELADANLGGKPAPSLHEVISP